MPACETRHRSPESGGGGTLRWLRCWCGCSGLGVVLVLGVDGAAEDCEAFWNGVVVDPSASFLAGDESCVAERFEVVADGRLGDAEGFDEIACGAGFSRCADQTE